MTLLIIEAAQLALVCLIGIYCVLDRRDGNRYRNDARELLGNSLDVALAGWVRGRKSVVAPLRENEQANGHREHEDFSHDLMVAARSDG